MSIDFTSTMSHLPPVSIDAHPSVHGSASATVLSSSGATATGTSADPATVQPASRLAAATVVANSNTALGLSPSAGTLGAQVARLNRYLSSSGRTATFSVTRSGGRNVIQELSADTRKVIAEYPAAEFPELARSLGAPPSLLLNENA
jgi:uncharacterized FlaG/YvyC family protein